MSEPTPSLPVGDLAAQFQDVVDEVSELLQAPAVLEDIDFALVAYCSQGLDVDPVRAASILGKTASAQVKAYFEERGIRTATAPLHVPGDPERQIAPRACLPARSDGRTFGYLWVLEPTSGIAAERLLLAEPLARRAGELLARRRGRVLERDRLVDGLVSGDVSLADRARTALVARGDLAGDQPIAVLVIRDQAGPVGKLVVSVPPDENGDGADPLGPALRRASRLVGERAGAGISVPRHSLEQLPAGLREADCAARVALARPRLGRVRSWAELGFYRLAAQGPEAIEALLAGSAATRLRERAEAELVRTALLYLDEAGHASRAATALSVHRQTLYYRLEKIEQLCGVDLDQGEARLQLHIGLALGELLPFLR
jgi:hypothetical protein